MPREQEQPRPRNIEGSRITKLRRLSLNELKLAGWDDHRGSVVAVLLDNGVVLFASRDEEGNGPGDLWGIDGKEVFSLQAGR